MLTKAQFNIYEVEHYGVEENSLDDLRKTGCTNILVLLRDHDRGLIQGCARPPRRCHGPEPTQIGVRLFMREPTRLPVFLRTGNEFPMTRSHGRRTEMNRLKTRIRACFRVIRANGKVEQHILIFDPA